MSGYQCSMKSSFSSVPSVPLRFILSSVASQDCFVVLLRHTECAYYFKTVASNSVIRLAVRCGLPSCGM
jgi:hypothetical protein